MAGAKRGLNVLISIKKGSEYKVVINEVVELAKRYSTERSHSFINGFLAGLVK